MIACALKTKHIDEVSGIQESQKNGESKPLLYKQHNPSQVMKERP